MWDAEWWNDVGFLLVGVGLLLVPALLAFGREGRETLAGAFQVRGVTRGSLRTVPSEVSPASSSRGEVSPDSGP